MKLFYLIRVRIKRKKFKHLMYTYRDAMFQMAYSILGDESLADEALYKSFADIIPHLDLLFSKKNTELKGFLLPVVKYTALEMKKGTDDVIEKTASETSALSAISLQISPGMNSSEIFQLLHKIEPVYQDLLIFTYLYGLEVEDAAKLLHLTKQAAETFFQYLVANNKTISN